MDDRNKLHGASGGVPEATDVAASARQPWHTPAIDVVPLKSAEVNNGTAHDGNGANGTNVC